MTSPDQMAMWQWSWSNVNVTMSLLIRWHCNNVAPNQMAVWQCVSWSDGTVSRVNLHYQHYALIILSNDTHPIMISRFLFNLQTKIPIKLMNFINLMKLMTFNLLQTPFITYHLTSKENIKMNSGLLLIYVILNFTTRKDVEGIICRNGFMLYLIKSI